MKVTKVKNNFWFSANAVFFVERGPAWLVE